MLTSERQERLKLSDKLTAAEKVGHWNAPAMTTKLTFDATMVIDCEAV